MMKRFRFLFTFLLILATLTTYSLWIFAESTTITILGTSDIHGRMQAWDYTTDEFDSDAGLGLIATVVKNVKAENPNVILVDAGDTIQDNMADLFNTEDIHPMILAMNEIGYDTWTLGNHEFNYGLDVLTRAINGFEGTVISGNIYKEDGTTFVSPYSVKEIAGVKVGILGMTTPLVPRWESSSPENIAGLSFNNPIEESKKWIKELKEKEDVDIIIGIFHIPVHTEYNVAGSGLDEILAANPELTAVICGHSHADIAGTLVSNVLVAEPKAYGNRVSRIDITLEKQEDKWVVVDRKSENINTKNLTEDKDVLKTIKKYHNEARDFVNTPIGTATADFVEPDEIEGIPTAQIQDTALMDLINKVQLKYSGADVSLAALFRADSIIKKGSVSIKEAALIYKYPNTLIKTKITGKQLKDLMEWSARYYNTYKPGDVTISFNPKIRIYNYDMFAGVEYMIDISKEPGERIVNLKFKGKPVTSDTILTLAINNYRYGNMVKDGYLNPEDKLWDSFEEMQDAGRIRELIIEYIKENKVIDAEVDNNWQIIGADLEHPLRELIIEMLKKGELQIPQSEDGRTPNVKSLNIFELIEDGKIPEEKLAELNEK